MSHTPSTLLCAVAIHYGHKSVSSVVSSQNPGERMAFMMLARANGFTPEQTANAMYSTPHHVETECNKLLKNSARRARYEKIVKLIQTKIGTMESHVALSGSPHQGVDVIFQVVCGHYDLSVQDITSHSSRILIPEARNIILHLVRELLPDITYTALALYFVNHKEETLPVKISAFRKKMANSNPLYDKVEHLKTMCVEKLHAEA